MKGRREERRAEHERREEKEKRRPNRGEMTRREDRKKRHFWGRGVLFVDGVQCSRRLKKHVLHVPVYSDQR